MPTHSKRLPSALGLVSWLAVCAAPACTDDTSGEGSPASSSSASSTGAGGSGGSGGHAGTGGSGGSGGHAGTGGSGGGGWGFVGLCFGDAGTDMIPTGAGT